MKNHSSRLAETMIVLALSAIQSLAQSVYEPYTFTTLAGGGGVTSPDQAGNAARFKYPNGVAVDSAAKPQPMERGIYSASAPGLESRRKDSSIGTWTVEAE